MNQLVEVYYESIKREPKRRGINKCRCDERLQNKTKEFTRLPYTGLVILSRTPLLFFSKLTTHSTNSSNGVLVQLAHHPQGKDQQHLEEGGKRTGPKTLIGWEASLAGSYAGDMFFVSFISQLVCILNPNYWTSCYRATKLLFSFADSQAILVA